MSKNIKIVGDVMEYCHYDYDYDDEEHDCLDYMDCDECPYYYADLDQQGRFTDHKQALACL